MTTLTELPEEVLLQVLASLDTLDLVACSLVCRRLQRVCEDELLWRLLLERGDQTWSVAVGLRRPTLADPPAPSAPSAPSASSVPSARLVCVRQTRASLERGRESAASGAAEPQMQPQIQIQLQLQTHQRRNWWDHITRRLPQWWRSSSSSSSSPPERKRVLMVGMSKSKLVYQLMWDPHTPLKMLGLEPGYESGVGSGIKFQLNEREFSLISVHSLQSIRQNVQLWGEFFSSANGLIIVLDCDQSTMGAFHSELDAVYDCVRKNTPILHIAKTADQKMTAPKVSKELGLYSYNHTWRLYTFNDQVETVASLKWGLSWLVKSMYEV